MKRLTGAALVLLSAAAQVSVAAGQPIRLLLSGQIYPAAIVIRKPNVGGGDLLCHLQVVCPADTIGTDGRVGIDFRAPDHGIFVGGVSLLGDFV